MDIDRQESELNYTSLHDPPNFSCWSKGNDTIIVK